MFTEEDNGLPRKVLRWDIEPYESAYLTWNEHRLVTSEAHFTLKTAEGSKRWQMEKPAEETDFVIPINSSNLHTPVQASVGRWHLEQDISYTPYRDTTPVHIYPVEGLFGGVTYKQFGGEEYTVYKEDRAGTATAWAVVENLSDRTQKVSVTLEFHFTHWILTHDKVTASVTVGPWAKTKVYVNVNTRALIGNRRATSVSTADITTEPQ